MASGDIKRNIETVRARVAEAAARGGLGTESVTLVAVTKTRSVSEINEAVAAGVTDIGENKVQEIMDKYDAVSPVRWHMIGHLQRNKVKYIIDKVKLIHSVDSYRLAEEIDARARQAGRVMDVLIQVNAAGEESKFGAAPRETGALLDEILARCGHIRVCGLMTVAPAADDPEDVRGYFRQVREMYDTFAAIRHERADFKYLSMGMSHDFGAAVAEGANLVRVGTAIFGPRTVSGTVKDKH